MVGNKEENTALHRDEMARVAVESLYYGEFTTGLQYCFMNHSNIRRNLATGEWSRESCLSVCWRLKIINFIVGFLENT